jgi:hypothetical protein
MGLGMSANEWLGSPADKFIAESFGIATADILVSKIPISGVDSRLTQAVLGAVAVKYGHKAHKLVSDYGHGVLLQLAAVIERGAILGGGGAIVGGGSVAGGSPVFGGA